MGRDLRELILAPAEAREAAAKELALTPYTQPALFAVEWALAKLWESFGLEPDAMLGHSIGEYTAACLAGVFSLEDGLRLVAARGRLIGALPAGGGMLAVHDSEQAVARALPQSLSIAAVNAPGLVVVSGSEDALSELERTLERQGVSTRRLHTSHAFHSRLMDPCLDAFRAVVSSVRLAPPELPLVSCSTGTWLTDEQATDPEYWVRHLRNAVRFADGIATLDDGSERLLLEVGPGETLRSLAELCTGGSESTPAVHSVRHPKEEDDDQAFLLRAVGAVWAHGVTLDWAGGLHADEVRRRVPLPSYPFERESFWVDAGKELLGVTDGTAGGASRLAEQADWFLRARVAPRRRRRSGPARRASAGSLFVDQGGRGRGAGRSAAPSAARTWSRSCPARRTSASRRASSSSTPATPRGIASCSTSWRRSVGCRPKSCIFGAPIRPTRSARRRPCKSGPSSACWLSDRPSGGSELEAPTCVSVVTTGLQDVFGGRPTAPEKATVLGPCKSLTAELPQVTGTSIDLAPGVGEGAADLAARLLAELENEARDPVVALHGPGRWALSYEPARLTEQPFEAAAARLREGGTYLITGGLGGIGLTPGRAPGRARRGQARADRASGLASARGVGHAPGLG